MYIRAYFEISHGGCAIHSLDFHPNGRKLVTGGIGSTGIAGEVNVWDLAPVSSSSKLQVLQLATANFQYGINCVRWSFSGKEIAVADDGRTVTILRLQSRTKGGNGKIVEIYRPVHTVTAHILEVLHVEFSPNGLMLASASLDATIRIWNVKKWPQCLAVLDSDRGGHTDAVKGCAWDPVGRLLATQSADRSLKIWKTGTWECIWTLTEPFVGSSQISMFSRLDWSPDGAVLIAPGAVNNSGPTAQIIMRGGREWTFEKDLVGHRRNLACVAFCKEMRIFTDYKKRKFFGYIVAVGGRDRTLSVWSMPRERRPIVVIKEIVQSSILDMRWHGRNLVICSLDGSTRILNFKESEIGVAVTESEMNQHCMRLYGCLLSGKNVSSTAGSEENNEEDLDEADKWSRKITELFKDLRAEPTKVPVRKRPKAVVPVREPTPPPKPPAPPQMEVRTKTGKKRIVPIFLGELEAAVDEPIKIPKLSNEFPDRHGADATKPNEKVEVEADVKHFLRTTKFVYQKSKQTRLNFDMDQDVSWRFPVVEAEPTTSTAIAAPYFGLRTFDTDDQTHRIYVMNENMVGTGAEIAEVQGLQASDVRINGHVVKCDINRSLLILLTSDDRLLLINRTDGKVTSETKLTATPRTLKVCSNWLLLFYESCEFSVINLSTPNVPVGKFLLKGSLKCFSSESPRLFVYDGIPVVFLKNRHCFVGSLADKTWAELRIEPSPCEDRFPQWLLSSPNSIANAMLTRIINRNAPQAPYRALVPSTTFAPALGFESERKLFKFFLKAARFNRLICVHRTDQSNLDRSIGYYQTVEETCDLCEIFRLVLLLDK